MPDKKTDCRLSYRPLGVDEMVSMPTDEWSLRCQRIEDELGRLARRVDKMAADIRVLRSRR